MPTETYNTLKNMVLWRHINGTYQSADEDIRWANEPVSDLWPGIEPNSDSSPDVSSDKGNKYQENLNDK